MTDEERMLWVELRGFRKIGFAFRKQAPIGPYVADFLCRKAMLVVEGDGRHHDLPDQIIKDSARDKCMSEQGYTVLRFLARDVWNNMDALVCGIENSILISPPQGGGG